jgi:hypothetical protein
MTSHFNGPLLDTGKKETSRGLFGGFPLSFDVDHHILFDDFNFVAVDSTNDWTVVKDASASVAIQADTVGGNLLMSSAATTENDGSSIQGNEVFKAAADRILYFEIRVSLSDADQMDFFAGFTVNFATNPEAVLTATDRIGFQIDDGNASILCKTEKDDTETSTDSGIDAADATFVKLGIRVIGIQAVEFYVNRNLVATHTTNIVDDEELTVAVMELSGDATGTKTAAVDYVLAASTR